MKFKKAKKEEKVEKDLSFIEEQMKNLEGRLRITDPTSEEYSLLLEQYQKLQDSQIKDETLESKKIENHNKSLEPMQKDKERKAGITKTTVSALAGVAAAVVIPLTEQKLGPAMSKLSGPAMSNIYKQK